MRTQDLLTLLSYRTYSSTNYIYRVAHYITSTYLSYTWEFVPLTTFIQVPLLPPLASGNHKTDLFFSEFFYLLVFEV